MPIFNTKLTDYVFPIVMAFCFLSLMAQVKIDLAWHELDIPITGQSLAVLLVGYVLGKKRGVMAVLLYLLLGMLGAPVFAKGASGWLVLTKGSGGFLYGFVAGAWVAGWFGDRDLGRHFLQALLAMTLGTAVIIAFGLLHLSVLYGFEKALDYGFYPFLPGALVKIILGAGLLWLWHRLGLSSAPKGQRKKEL